MAEPDDSLSNKRKASPGAETEDVSAKRTKVQDGDEATSPRNGNNDVDKELIETGNGVAPQKEDQGGMDTARSPPRQHRTEAEPEPRRSPEARRPSVTSGPPPRRNFSLEEKRRGQRLFGGLVSALSRPPSSSQQQKRLEIERRQQERAQQRRADDEKRRAEKLEKLERVRKIEQVKLDEQAMRTRHSTILAQARSLQTRSEPRIYYLPWRPTKEQENTIKEQVHAAEQTIDRETRDFKTRRERRLKELGVVPPPRSPSPLRQKQQQQPEERTEPVSDKATVGEPKPPLQDANPGAVASPPSEERNDHHDKDHDENADEMVQDAEDTVIY